MQGKDFLYFLTDELGRSYYVENGIVKVSAQPRPLEYTPEGWMEILVQLIKNQKYFALDRGVTVPLDFVEDGAIIVKDAYYKKGGKAQLWLVMSKQELYYDGIEYGYSYKGVYRGALDFSEFNHTGPKVTISISEDGPVKYIKANENAIYEIDVDVPEAMKIKMDGIRLRGTKRFVVIDPTYNHGIDGGVKEMIPMQETNSEGYFFNIGFASSAGSITDADYDFIQGEDLSTSDKWNGVISEADSVSYSIHFEGKIMVERGTGAYASRVGFDIKLETSTGRLFTLGNISNDFGPFDTAVPYSFSIDSAEITLFKDETFFIYQVPTAFQSTNRWHYEEGAIFEYHTKDRYKTTYIKALPLLYVYKKLIEKVTGGRYQADSTLLDDNFNIPITCGDAIRGIAGAIIKTSLSKLFQAVNSGAIWTAGMGVIGGVIRIEKKDRWVDYSDPIDLGEVTNLSVKPAEDYIFNQLNIGYEPQDYDDVNGRQEFNNTSRYTGPETEVTKSLDLISPYRADSYGIEFTRINLEGKTTTDSSSDNDVSFIHVNATPINDPIEGIVYTLNRDLNAFATGLIEPESVFNIYLSPSRCADRSGSFIHSCFYKMDGEFLTWQTTDKNADLATTNPVVIEKSNKHIGSLAPALFTSNILEFEAPSPVNLLELHAASPGRAFKCRYLGIPLKGIAVKIGIRLGDYEVQTIQLLSAPDNDLEQLINVAD